MRVRFRPVSELPDNPAAPVAAGPVPPARGDFRDREGIASSGPPDPAGSRPAAAVIEVVRPGPLATVQDLGRPALGHLGVPRSGAADAASLRRANRLAGNPPGAAGLEFTLGRAVLRFSRDALAVAGSAGDPVALVDALRARQLACCAPDGVAERALLASRMLEAADAAGSAWLEMWGRLWRIDTLFETGQLRSVRPELADLESCVERVPGPLGQWHFLETSATLALATGRFTEAKRLAADAFKAFSDTGHPMAFGGCAVILGQAGLHIGFGRSGFVELFDQIPAHLRPDAVDTTRGIATVFPALSFALIRLHQGDRAAAEAAYAQAGPVRSWTPVPAMSLAAWAHGLPVAIGLSRTQDIEFLAARFEPFRGQHVANGAGPGVYMGPVELPLGQAAAALGRLDPAVEDLRTAASICEANGARGYAVQARVELAADVRELVLRCELPAVEAADRILAAYDE